MLKILSGNNSTTFVYAGLVNGFEKLQSESDPSIDPYVNDAVGTIQLRNSTDTADIGVAISWIYITGSNGDYYAQSPGGLNILPGDTIKVRVVFQAPGGLSLDGIYDVLVEERKD